VHLAPIASAACRRPSLSRPLEPLGCSLPGRRRPPDCRRHRQLDLIAPPRALLRAFPWAPPAAVGLLVDAAGNGSEPSRSFASVRRGRKGRQPPAGTARHYGRREVCLLHARAAPCPSCEDLVSDLMNCIWIRGECGEASEAATS